VKWKKHYHIMDFMVQIFWRIICGHMVCLHKFSWIFEAICVFLISFYKKNNKMHTTIRIRYPDIREDLSEKVSGYSISDGYQTYCIRIWYLNKISIFVSVIRKKSGYPKIPSEPVFTIFESRSGRIFSEPYYIPTYVCQGPFPHICWHHKCNISKDNAIKA
jgi:hypothetical protein